MCRLHRFNALITFLAFITIVTRCDANTSCTNPDESSLLQKRMELHSGITTFADPALSSSVGHWNFDETLDPLTIPEVNVSDGGHALHCQKGSSKRPYAEVLTKSGLFDSGALTFPDRSSAVGVVPPFRSFSMWAKRDVGCCNRIKNWVVARRGVGGKLYMLLWVHFETVRVSLYDSSGKKVKEVRTDLKIATKEEWLHLAVTVATDVVTLYVNGVGKSSKRKVPTPGLDDLELQIGTGGPHHQFKGVLDDVHIYSEALMADTVLDITKTTLAKLAVDSVDAPPLADAGSNQTFELPVSSPIQLKGKCVKKSSSSTQVFANWSLVSSPKNNVATLEDAFKETAQASFGSDASAGKYVFQLQCSDGSLTSVSQVHFILKTDGMNTLLAYWRFDQPFGTRSMQDNSGEGHMLTSRRYSFQHPFAELRPGEGLGGSGGIRFYSRSRATATVLPFRSFSMWAKRDVGCCNRITNWVVARRGAAGDPYLKVWVHFETVRVSLYDSSGKNVKEVRTDLKIATKEEWLHLAVTVAPDMVTLYVNGVGKSSKGKVPTPGLDDLELQLGTGGPHHQFLGILDEVRVHESALTKSAISKLASAWKLGGIIDGEQLPPLTDAGRPQTLWKPISTIEVTGRCDMQIASNSVAHAEWSIVTAPQVSAVELSGKLSLNATLKFKDVAPAGDYDLQLKCSQGERFSVSSVRLTLFDAHESISGQTIQTEAVPQSFVDADKPFTPQGIWLFDGSASQPIFGGVDAKLHPVRHAENMKLEFTSEGRFGGGLRLHCNDAGCGQLSLGNPETKEVPWEAISVSFWFKSDKVEKLAMFQKGNFKVDCPKMSDEDAGQWHHVVVTMGPDFRKEYFDGLLKVTRDGMKRTIADAVSNMSFGITSGHASYGFDGIVDELAVFDFILSNDEVDLLRANSVAEFAKREALNPAWLGAFNSSMLGSYFTELPHSPNYQGLFTGLAPSKASLPAYMHPRIFFGPEDLPSIRQRLQSTAAGLIAMENVRGLLREEWPAEALSKRNLTLKEMMSDTNLQQRFIFEAFRCLIDGDRDAALRLGQQLHALAEEQLVALHLGLGNLGMASETAGPLFNDTWKDVGQPIMLRGTTMAFCYDFLYPYLPGTTRNKIRQALALSTERTWSIGMDAVQAYNGLISNWQPWVTGDLMLTLTSIEGEDGFDKGVYARVAYSFHGWTTLGISAVSGSTYEGGGKNSIVGPKLLVLAKHGHPQYIAAPSVRKFAHDFLIHTMLPNGNFIEDDLWGGCESKPLLEDALALKVAFPNSSKVDWVYRNAVDGDGYAGVFYDNEGSWPYRQFQPARATSYGYNNFVQALIYARDYSGPSDWALHAHQALASEPLTYVAKDRGLLITRSAWADKAAAWLWFNIRSLRGGHAAPARGGFAFYALGEVWGFYNSGHNEVSEKHSVILVDGQGQGTVMGKFLKFIDAPEVTWGTADLRHAYSSGHFGETFTVETVNSYMIEPGPYPWQKLPYCYMPNWYDGVSRDGTCSAPSQSRSFTKAFRTVGLVRSSTQPYALIFDDIQKDSVVRVYSWRMSLRNKLAKFNHASGLFPIEDVDYSYAKADGNDIVIRQANGGSKRLLVRLLDGSSPYKSIGVNVTEKKGLTDAGYAALQIDSEVASAVFRVLLWPLEDGAPFPSTSWDAIAKTLHISAMTESTQDVFHLGTDENGATVIDGMEIAGKKVSFEANRILSKE